MTVVEHAVEVAHVGQLQVVVRIAPGQQRGARRRAQRDRREGAAELHPRRGDRVHGRRTAHRGAVAAQRIVAKLVGEQYQNVRLLRHRTSLIPRSPAAVDSHAAEVRNGLRPVFWVPMARMRSARSV